MCCFYFKQRTAHEVRISDWSSDVCSSDLSKVRGRFVRHCLAMPDRAARAKVQFYAARGQRPSSLRAAGRQRGNPGRAQTEIGRASCMERVCQYVTIHDVAVSVKKRITTTHTFSTIL